MNFLKRANINVCQLLRLRMNQPQNGEVSGKRLDHQPALEDLAIFVF